MPSFFLLQSCLKLDAPCSNFTPFFFSLLHFSVLYCLRNILCDGHSGAGALPHLTAKSLPISAQNKTQGALHAQRDKVNDKKIKIGGDLPSRAAACMRCWHYLLHYLIGLEMMWWDCCTSPTTQLICYLPWKAYLTCKWVNLRFNEPNFKNW